MESSKFTSLYQQLLQIRNGAAGSNMPPWTESPIVIELYDELVKICFDPHVERMKQYFGEKSWPKDKLGYSSIAADTLTAAINDFFARIEHGEVISGAILWIKDMAWTYFVQPIKKYPMLYAPNTRKELVKFLRNTKKADINEAEFAADAAIESVIRRLLGKKRHTEIEDIHKYLKLVATNKFKNERTRKERPMDSGVQNEDDGDGHETDMFEKNVLFQTGERAPDEQLDSKYITEIVIRCMAQLNETDQQSLKLDNYDDLSNREAAEQLGISEGSMNQRIHRAKKNLKILLRKYGFGKEGDQDLNNPQEG